MARCNGSHGQRVLLVSERFDRIDARGPDRRDERGGERHESEQQRRRRRRCRGRSCRMPNNWCSMSRPAATAPREADASPTTASLMPWPTTSDSTDPAPRPAPSAAPSPACDASRRTTSRRRCRWLPAAARCPAKTASSVRGQPALADGVAHQRRPSCAPSRCGWSRSTACSAARSALTICIGSPAVRTAIGEERSGRCRYGKIQLHAPIGVEPLVRRVLDHANHLEPRGLRASGCRRT